MTIVEELRNDRESGARRLESEYKAGLMILARRLCADPSDAEELVNRTFAAVVEGIDGFLEQSSLFTWMCRILNHIYSSDCRRKSRQMEVCQGDLSDVEDDRAQDEVYRNLDAALVRDAIDALSPEHRETLLLHYFMDIPVAKMAKILAVPAGTVHSRLHYARKALAAKLGVKAHEMARKPGAKALLVALALVCTAALGAGIYRLGRGEPSRRAAAGSRLSTFDPPTQQEQPMDKSSLRTLAASAASAAARGGAAPTLADPAPVPSSASSQLVVVDGRTRTEAASGTLANFSSSPLFPTTLIFK